MTDAEDAGLVSLYSLATWTNGLAFKSINFTPTGKPVIKIAEVKKGIGPQTKFTDGSFDEKFRIRAGDMIFCWSGQPETSIGTSYWRGPEGWLNQHLFKVVPNEKLVDPSYFYFVMQSLLPRFVEIARNKQTTGLGHVTKQDLVALQVSLPPLTEQRRIASVLESLDHLIELNRRLFADCEALAQALSASAPGRVSLAHLATWGGLSNITPLGMVDHYSLPSFDSGREPERVSGNGIKSSKQEIDRDTVLVSRLNPHIPRVWMVYPDPLVQCVASTEFVPLFGKGIPTELVYALSSAPGYLRQMRGLVTGTTGSHQRIDKDALVKAEVPDVRNLPPTTSGAIVALVRQAHASRLENSELARIRHELLPLLTSGRVRVGDVAA
jgi:type I restriction enzyme S subunit